MVLKKVTTKNNVHSYVCSDFNSTTTWRKKIEKKNGNINFNHVSMARKKLNDNQELDHHVLLLLYSSVPMTT